MLGRVPFKMESKTYHLRNVYAGITFEFGYKYARNDMYRQVIQPVYGKIKLIKCQECVQMNVEC